MVSAALCLIAHKIGKFNQNYPVSRVPNGPGGGRYRIAT